MRGNPKVCPRPQPEAQLIRPSFATALEALSGLLHLNDVEPGAGQPGIHQASSCCLRRRIPKMIRSRNKDRETATLLFPPCFFSVILPAGKLYK
jgi:hypothetical protein